MLCSVLQLEFSVHFSFSTSIGSTSMSYFSSRTVYSSLTYEITGSVNEGLYSLMGSSVEMVDARLFPRPGKPIETVFFVYSFSTVSGTSFGSMASLCSTSSLSVFLKDDMSVTVSTFLVYVGWVLYSCGSAVGSLRVGSPNYVFVQCVKIQLVPGRVGRSEFGFEREFPFLIPGCAFSALWWPSVSPPAVNGGCLVSVALVSVNVFSVMCTFTM